MIYCLCIILWYSQCFCLVIFNFGACRHLAWVKCNVIWCDAAKDSVAECDKLLTDDNGVVFHVLLSRKMLSHENSIQNVYLQKFEYHVKVHFFSCNLIQKVKLKYIVDLLDKVSKNQYLKLL